MDYSDSLSDNDYSFDKEPKKEVITAPINHFISLFKLQDFKHSKSTKFPPFTDNDYNLALLNTPIIPTPPLHLQSVDCTYLMCSQSDHFPKTGSVYYKKKPTIYMWRNMDNILPSYFTSYIQDYFHDKYEKMKTPMRYFFQVLPTIDKLQNARTIRRDIQSGRILFHYIGYGFPKIDDKIYAIDKKTNSFVDFPIKNLFENLKPPTWFVFDCDNAENALINLNRTAEAHLRANQMKGNINDMNIKNQTTKTTTTTTKMSSNQQNIQQTTRIQRQQIDDYYNWDDWFCFCATSLGEQLPQDPHLPRDFFTSCLLTPTRLSLLCHILQYYRLSIIREDWSITDLENNLLLMDEGIDKKYTPLHDSLLKILSAITDAIASESLPYDQYMKYFRSEKMTANLFQRFLLAQYLLRTYQIHPKSKPALPDLSIHPLWQEWKQALDIAVISTTKLYPNNAIITKIPTDFISQNYFLKDIFIRAAESFTRYEETSRLEEMPTGLLTLVFHIPEDKDLQARALLLLSKFASISDETRTKLSKFANYEPLFPFLLSGKFNDNPDAFHAICYLIIVFLNNDQSLAAIHPILDVKKLTDFLFSDNLLEETKTLIACIIATLIPYNDQLRQMTVHQTFALKLRSLLENSSSELSLWCLLIQRRLFDSFGVDLFTFYNNGIHIQIASFCLHFAPEVRSAALATLPCLLQRGQDLANMQLFGLAMFCGFDGSYVVRYNFILFLTRFLSIYSDKISGHIPIGLLAHQLFGAVVATWAGLEFSDIVSLGEIISNFDALCTMVTSILRFQDSLQRFIGIGLFLAEYLNDDPHPSVQQAANKLYKRNMILAGLRQKIINSATNANSVPTITQNPVTYVGSLPTDLTQAKDLSEKEEESSTAVNESGGDAIYKACMSQVVRSGCWKTHELTTKNQFTYSHHNSFASSSSIDKIISSSNSLNQISSIQTSLSLNSISQQSSQANIHYFIRNKYDQQVTALSYDSMSRDCIIGFTNGVMRYIHEYNNVSTDIKLSSKITSLELTTINSQICAIAGTDDGCCHIWDGLSEFPQQSFRTDGLPKSKAPQLIAVLNNEPYVLTARGNCGSLRLWDIRAQRLVNEWVATQNNKDNIISAIAVDPVTSQVYVGHSSGLIALLDVKCEEIQKIPNFNSCGTNEKILTIKGNVSSTKRMYAATIKGNISTWSNFNSSINPFMKLDSANITSIDFHKTQPLIAMSTPETVPTVITNKGKMVATLKECGVSALVSFHPSLPILGVCTKEGYFYEYDLTCLL